MTRHKKSRVVLASDSLDPSGMGEHMLTLARAFAPGIDATLALMPSQSALLTRATRQGLAVKHIDGHDEFVDWLRSSRTDLLHVHAGIGWEGHALAKAGREAGIPVIRTEHLPYLLTDPDQKAEFQKELEDIACVIAVSEASAQTFRANKVDTHKLAVVQNGIFALEPGDARAQVRAELELFASKILLTVARFSQQKDHVTLLQALPGVLVAHPDTILVLVGEGAELENVKALAAKLHLSEQVRFAGQRSDIADLMAIADLFVLPSRFEGLPLAILEAMSIGLPVIATRIGGNVEALGEDHPALVEPGDVAGLADTISRMLAHSASSNTVGAAQQARFHTRFQASRMAGQTEAVYRRVISTSSEEQQEETSMDRTRIGFIGVGGIAHRHLDVLAGFDDVELVAFADPDFSRAEQAALRFGARAFGHHQTMLESSDLDAVFVCIPPFAHGEAERDLIAAHIPFFVEKPISLDFALAEELAAAIEAANLITAVGYHWRYLDIVDEARTVVADNPAHLISGYWLDQTPPPRWWWKADHSGGQMVEQTTHILDLARYLVGDIASVYGLAAHRSRGDFPDLDVPTASTASLRFKSGAIGNIGSTCLLRWGHHVGLNVFCDGLALEITDHDLMIDVGQGRPIRRAEGDPVWREDRDFVDAVRGGQNVIRCPYHEALATHRVALAVNQSAQSGQAIRIA